jgi:hypothetical protein
MILTEQVAITEGLQYHLENEIPLDENVFRFGSIKFFRLYNEARTLYEKGQLTPIDELEEFFLESDIGKVEWFEGKKVMLDFPMPIDESEYKGRDVELNKPKRGGDKKFYVYVRDPKTKNIKRIEFGAEGGGGKLAVKLRDPDARKAFASRHNCDQKKDKTKAGYWSCRLPRYAKQLGLKGAKGRFW